MVWQKEFQNLIIWKDLAIHEEFKDDQALITECPMDFLLIETVIDR